MRGAIYDTEKNEDSSILTNKIQDLEKEIEKQFNDMSCIINIDNTVLNNIVDDIDKTDNSIENNEENQQISSENNEENQQISSENNEEDINVVEIIIKNSEND